MDGETTMMTINDTADGIILDDLFGEHRNARQDCYGNWDTKRSY